MSEQDEFDEIIRILASLDVAPQADPRRQAAARRALLERAAGLRSAGEPRGRTLAWPALRLALSGAIAVALALVALTGVAYAADAARPGDALYGLDRGMEALRLRVAPGPDGAARLLLEFAGERLLETEQLTAAGDVDSTTEALDAYTQTLSDLQELSQYGASNVSNDLIDTVVATHEQRLLALRARLPQQASRSFDRALQEARKLQQDSGGEAEQPEPDNQQQPASGGSAGTKGPDGKAPGGSNSHPDNGPPEDKVKKEKKEKKQHSPGGPNH